MKVRRISQFQTQIYFPDFDSHYEKYKESFLTTDLGKIHRSIPWKECVQALRLREYDKGPKSIFSPIGKLALMFLKHYTGSSDRRLIEQLNGNIYYQIFCDLILPPGYHIDNFKIVSQIRCELAGKLNIEALEQVLMKTWKPHMRNQDSITCDATCYESSIKYPTDVKLLYDSVVWIYAQISKICKRHKVRMPRTKYKKWVRRSISFSKMRQKRRKKRISLTRGLLRLLTKLIKELDLIHLTHGVLKNHAKYHRRLNTIRQISKQQWDKFFKGVRPKEAIVSIDKP